MKASRGVQKRAFLFDTRGGAHQTSGQERRILDVCRPMRFVRFLCVYASLQKREKKSESRASRVARATRERRIERAKSFETYRTHRFHRGLGRFARILPLSRAGLRV
jgi:hypothetical protein